MSDLQFIPADDNPRLGINAEIMRLLSDDMHPHQAYQELLGAIRRAYGNNCYAEANTTGLPAGSYRITRALKEDQTEAVPNHSPWQFAGVPIRSGGAIAQMIARKKPCVTRSMTISPDDPIFPELGNCRSACAIPGGYGDPDNWAFILDNSPNAFDVEYLEDVTLSIGLIATAMKNLEALGALRRANAFIDAEVNRIAAIQQALLPDATPKIPGLQVAASSRTFERAGGDLYDYLEVPGGRCAFMIADASGHGPSAAVVAAMLNAILRAFPAGRAGRTDPPAISEVLAYANAQLASKRIENSFVTAFLARWDPALRTFTYSRAGHNPPLLRKSSGEILELNAVGNLPLAILPDTQYDQHVQQLAPGDVIVLFTDGIVEMVNPAGEQFGDARLRSALADSRGSASEILAELLTALENHAKNLRPRDDQTIMVLKVT